MSRRHVYSVKFNDYGHRYVVADTIECAIREFYRDFKEAMPQAEAPVIVAFKYVGECAIAESAPEPQP